MTFYDYKVTAPDGTEVSMNDFEGKVVLVVNTAKSSLKENVLPCKIRNCIIGFL